jgi:hypothetical protein
VSINYSGRYYIPNLILFIGWQQLSYSYFSLPAPLLSHMHLKLLLNPVPVISDSAVKRLTLQLFSVSFKCKPRDRTTARVEPEHEPGTANCYVMSLLHATQTVSSTLFQGLSSFCESHGPCVLSALDP